MNAGKDERMYSSVVLQLISTRSIHSYILIFMPMIQDYALYTPDDQAVWQTLFRRQMRQLPGRASASFFEGLEAVGFSEDHIPDYRETNRRLKQLTGWAIEVVPGLIPNRPFFELLHNRRFCASTWLRKKEQLDYLEEPDMFHDAFGHVPMLANACLLYTSPSPRD